MQNNFKKLIGKYGETHQKIKAIEEFSELQKEICKDLIGKGSKNILDEIVDVEIMVKQLKIIYIQTERDKEIYTNFMNQKKARIKALLKAQ